MKENWRFAMSIIGPSILTGIFLMVQVSFGLFQLPARMEKLEARFDKMERSIENLKDALISGLVARNK